jgi:hypothetical protein
MLLISTVLSSHLNDNIDANFELKVGGRRANRLKIKIKIMKCLSKFIPSLRCSIVSDVLEQVKL